TRRCAEIRRTPSCATAPRPCRRFRPTWWRDPQTLGRGPTPRRRPVRRAASGDACLGTPLPLVLPPPATSAREIRGRTIYRAPPAILRARWVGIRRADVRASPAARTRLRRAGLLRPPVSNRCLFSLDPAPPRRG